MDDLFTLSLSAKEQEFVKFGLEMELDVSSDIVETFCDIPYIGSLLKIRRVGCKFQELHFVRKLAKFLEKEQEIPLEKKERFLNGLNSKQRKKMYEYITHYLIRAEDDAKADIMGYIYKERVCGRIDDEMFLRLCSIVDRAFVFDIKALPKYVETNSEDSIEANNFINLGLMDNYVGGVWKDEPYFVLNETGQTLHRILTQNGWYERME